MDRRVTIAVDCDLHRIHCICSGCGVVTKSRPSLDTVFRHLEQHTHSFAGQEFTLLFEVASPMAYRDGKAAHYNLAKWMIFNTAMASCAAIAAPEMLVSPSNKWTLGYELAARHKMARATATTKDLRECEAMIAFYTMDPKQWVTFPDYLAAL